jgi:hypothetical protein
MFVIVIHRIHDRAGFRAAEAQALAAVMPDGVTFPAHTTSADHRLGISLCEGESVTAVRDVVEGTIGQFADSEYYEMVSSGSGPAWKSRDEALTRNQV